MKTLNKTPFIGILMLQSRFPRIVGDVGNKETWPIPVHFKTVENASPHQVVRNRADGLLNDFINAGRVLIDENASAITTSCGFLALFQKELSEALDVPVMTSSLMQVEMVNRMLPAGKRTGVLTISATSLSIEHLKCANVPVDTPIGTTENGQEFTRAILNDEPNLNVSLAKEDNIEAAIALQNANPNLGAIVLECTNMVPYAHDIARETGLPVYSIYTLVQWMYSGLVPRDFMANQL
ncbi:MAG: aspartate/glutamate racemase family protein [Rhizobiaceae bacterium]|nr:aspartate/glutamate racemase family protein [Rhizobiaceae bacterium]